MSNVKSILSPSGSLNSGLLANKQRGVHVIELAILLPFLIIAGLMAVEPVVLRHRYNFARLQLEKLANEARADERLLVDLWTSGKGRQNTEADVAKFNYARDNLSDQFKSWAQSQSGLNVVPIKHLDRTLGKESLSSPLSIGYMPPGTSGEIVGWTDTQLHNSFRCLKQMDRESLVLGDSSERDDEDNGDRDEDDDEDQDDRRLARLSSSCPEDRRIDTTRPDHSLTTLSTYLPTEISAALEVRGLLSGIFGPWKILITVPFYPKSKRASAPLQECKQSWKAGPWAPDYPVNGCGPMSRSRVDTDGCARFQPVNEYRCVGNCGWTRVAGSETGCSASCGGGQRWYQAQDACGTIESRAEGCNTEACPQVPPQSTPQGQPQRACYNLNVRRMAQRGANLRNATQSVGEFLGSYPNCLVGMLASQREQRGGAVETQLRDERLARQLGAESEGSDFWVTLDDSCNIIARDELRSGCLAGEFRWEFSPVSLLWENGHDLESSFTVSEFPLQLNGVKGQSYQWRASSEAPLLVWDPAGERNVRDATQLFGNHTFGKKWKNGYEALETLDTDSDGKLKDKELKSIALWFDADRDGVSDPNEVKGAQEAGVVSVFVTPDRTDPKNGWVHASKGYERVVNGKVETLPSVDWFAKPYSGLAEAIATSGSGSESSRASSVSGVSDGSDGQVKGSEPSSQGKGSKADAKAVEGARLISGTWLWASNPKVPSREKRVGDGVLSFLDAGKGTFKGMSFLEVPVESNADKVAKIQLGFPLEGTFEGKNPKGEATYRFVVVDKKTGQETSSQVTLSSDGKTLRGRSKSKTRDGQLEYGWTAIRLNPEN